MKGVTTHPGMVRKASGIHINPKHKGELHSDLDIPQGQPIPESRLKSAENSPDPAVRKRAQFADNARGWNKK